MLAKRIIPCLDVKDGRVVKGTQFVDLRDAGDPVENAKIYDQQGADEIAFLDITASYEKRDILLDIVRRTAEEIFIPLTVGGGVRRLEDIRTLLKAGADKVSVNTAAVKDPAFRGKGVEAIREPVYRHCHRCEKERRHLGSLHPRRPGSDRDRCGPLGKEDGGTGSGRDPADQHGPGWDKGRLRYRVDPDHFRTGLHSRHRFRGGGHTRTSLRRTRPWKGQRRACGFDFSLQGIFHFPGQVVSERKRSRGKTLEKGFRVRKGF